jgi:predicted metalloprotease with PDZ domain
MFNCRWVILGIVLLYPSLLVSQEDFTYRVSYSEAGSDRIHVRMESKSLFPGPQVLVIPRAIPMGYAEQHYDRYVSEVKAYDSSNTLLPVSMGDGPRWHVGDDDATVSRVEYAIDIRQMELEITSAADTSKVRPDYLSLLGYSVFGYMEGFKDLPIKLTIQVPTHWPVMSTLAPQTPPPTGTTQGKAANFYALADSQIVAGPALTVKKLDAKVPLFFALYAEGDVDVEIMGELAEKAMAAVLEYFGDAPFSHYTVHQELLRPLSERHSYGFSMEHLDSATFYLSDDRGLTSSSPPRELVRTRYNFAHHFAHAWIPKRAYSKGYFPFTWELAPVLDTIWFSEGFPQYAAIEAIADTMPEEKGLEYRERMLQMRFRRNLETAPLFIRRMSAVELSRVASTRYSEDFRTGRNVFSRGGLMAAAMDALIREKSGGSKRLRDALRYLMEWSQKNQRPFTIEELPVIFKEATGINTSDVLERWLKPQMQ